MNGFSRGALPAVLLGAFCALAAPARAQFDPALHWQTLETPHFRVHYHDGLDALAQRTARAAEAAHARLVPRLGHDPGRRVDIVLSDDTDDANGSAGAYLRPAIYLYATSPDSRSELNDFEDYLWNLVTHEYTHVLHHDQIGGVPSWFNRVFGQLWVPNGYMPRWYTEGLAVWSESELSGGGRDRSSLYDMYLRAEILDDRFFGIDDAGGAPSSFPRGAVAYLHGSRFVDWVARTRGGPALLPRLNEDYGSQPYPFLMEHADRTAASDLGVSWAALYAAWQAELTREVAELRSRLSEQGLTPVHRLTRDGELTGQPRFAVSKLFYVESTGDRRPAVHAIDLATSRDRAVAELFTTGALAVAADGTWGLVAQRVPHHTYYSFTDLFRLDLASGALEQITHGARVTETDIAPDGRSAVAVQHPGSGRSALALLSLDSRRLRTVYEPPRGCIVFTPRFSPDGRTVAFSEQCPAGRDIRLLDMGTRELTSITRDRALDLDPAFDPSGRYLLFASDRTGIYNLYARDLRTGETWQVTNALTGAFEPAVSADASRLAFVTYSSTGYDLAEMPFAPDSWRPAPDSQVQRPPPLEWEDDSTSQPRPYSALPTLRPYYWLPIVQSAGLGLELGAQTGGADVVGLFDWAASATWGVETRRLGFDTAFSARVIRPELSLALGSHPYPIPRAPDGEFERQTDAGLTATWRFAWLDRRLSLSLGYGLRFYDPDSIPLPRAPDGPLPFRVEPGRLATVMGSVGFSNARAFADGISPASGFTMRLTLRGAAPETWSQFSFASAQASASTYFAMPWADSHVLALALSGGLSAGDVGHRPIFALGGIGIRNPFIDALNQTGSYGPALRGYAPIAVFGSQFALANAEYRFPVLRIDSGWGLWPVYLGRVHAALTADAGMASDRLALDQLRTSVGAELRMNVLVLYQLGFDVRFGYARGLARDGIDEVFLTLGSSF